MEVHDRFFSFCATFMHFNSVIVMVKVMVILQCQWTIYNHKNASTFFQDCDGMKLFMFQRTLHCIQKETDSIIAYHLFKYFLRPMNSMTIVMDGGNMSFEILLSFPFFNFFYGLFVYMYRFRDVDQSTGWILWADQHQQVHAQLIIQVLEPPTIPALPLLPFRAQPLHLIMLMLMVMEILSSHG